MLTPPGPVGLPIIGNIEAYEQDRLGFLIHCAEEYGDIVKYSDRVYIINSPVLIEQVLSRSNQEFIIPQNVLLERVPDDKTPLWMQKRKVVTGGMRHSSIDGFVPRIVDITENVLRSWQWGQELTIPQQMERITSSVICEYCFGPDGSLVAPVATRLLNALFGIIGNPMIFPTWFPTPTRVRIGWHFHTFERTISSIIENRRLSLQKPADLLSTLMHTTDGNGGQPDDKEIGFLLVGSVLAALRVPANALAWIWYLLAENAEVENNLYGELQNILGNLPPSGDDLPKLKYTERVVKEALRLYPPTWLIQREVAKDCTLGGYPLAIGQKLLLSPYVVQRDPRFFKEPHSFIPDRWLDEEEIKSRPKFAYFPFGGGPRNCLGASFSMAELVIVIATIACKAKLSIKRGAKVVPDPRQTLLPKGLIMIPESRS